MIDAALPELEANLSLKRACALLGRPRASHYRSLQPVKDTVRQPRASPPNALTPAEQEQVLAVLRAPQHCDLAVSKAVSARPWSSSSPSSFSNACSPPPH